jgi:hypothetical protein
MWLAVEELFEGIRKLLRDGSGKRSGLFNIPWSRAMFLFWCDVADSPVESWLRSSLVIRKRRFDALFDYQNLAADVSRYEIRYTSKRDFKLLQRMAGLFGMVAVSRGVEDNEEIIHRFETGTVLKVCILITFILCILITFLFYTSGSDA